MHVMQNHSLVDLFEVAVVASVLVVVVKIKVKVKLSLCLTKHHTMKICWGVEI